MSQKVAMLVYGAALGGYIGPERSDSAFQAGRAIGDQVY